MYRILSGIMTLTQHIATLLSNPESYRPPQCPTCFLAGLWKHGFYTRKADRCVILTDESHPPILIPRYLCPGCGHTCSRLPSCIPPGRWYSWLFQQKVLLYLLGSYTLHGCQTRFAVCRSTIRRWWNWLISRTSVFEFNLRSRIPEWGRFADFESFWIGALNCMPLSEMMASLDHDGLIIP